MFGYKVGDSREDLSFNDQDNADMMLKAVVVDPAYDWSDQDRPRRALNECVRGRPW